MDPSPLSSSVNLSSEIDSSSPQSSSVSLFSEVDLPSSGICTPVSNGNEDEDEHTWNGPFTFILGADPQFGMFGNCKLKRSVCTSHPEIKLCREAIVQVNAMRPKPKFFVVCGDMLDAFPFDKDTIPHFNNNDILVRDQQFADFVKVFEELDPEIKLVFACGNHDVGDIPTAESLAKYRREFGQDYYSFWVGGVKFVVLNSQFFYSPDAVPEETQKQNKWIEENLADDCAKYIVVFQHIPFFSEEPGEDTIFSNIPIEQRLDLLEKFYQAGVRYVFCGHLHKNAGGKYRDMEQVVATSMGATFGNDPSGYLVVHVGESHITHSYVKLRDTTDCSEFEVANDNESIKEETKSIKSLTISEKIRRSRWLWVCCGSNSGSIEENDGTT